MKSPTRTNLAANAAVDAMAALLDGGWIDIYTGVQPTLASDPAVGTLLASLQFGSPAFASGVAGVAQANAITQESDAPATGTAAWYRCKRADHTTGVMDGSVGMSNANLILTSTSIVIHGQVPLSSFALTERK